MQLLTVHHLTTYRYKQPVSFGEHRMMLRPRDSYDQRLIDTRLAITPESIELRWVHDVFGNCVALARFSGRADELRFESTISLDHSASNVLDFQIEDFARNSPFSYGSEEQPDLLRSIERQYLDPNREVDNWARQFMRHNGLTDTRAMLRAMNAAINERFTYIERDEMGTQDPTVTLRLGSGSCRDFALLMMEAVRPLGLPAPVRSRYPFFPRQNPPGPSGRRAAHSRP